MRNGACIQITSVRGEKPLFISVQRSGSPLYRWPEWFVALTLSETILLVHSSVLVLLAENIPILEQATVLRVTLCDVVFMVDFLAWVELRYSWSGKLVMFCFLT